MICKNCPVGRRYAAGSIYCLLYGMIIRDDHECTREGGKRHERYEGDPGEERKETGLQEDGWDAADSLPGLLSGAGERSGIYGLEEEWPE